MVLRKSCFGAANKFICVAILCLLLALTTADNLKPAVKIGIVDYVHNGLDWTEGFCATGMKQTPIHIHEVDSLVERDSEAYGKLADVPKATLEYEHNKLMVEYSDGEFHLKHSDGETEWKSLQFHFHSPADHHIDHNHYDVEFHIVFQNVKDSSKYLGTGIFFQRDWRTKERNEFLDSLNLDDITEGMHSRDIKLSGLLDRFIGTRVYNYEGSLSIPPCTENVEWIVFDKPIRVPDEQINPFLKMWSYNKKFAKGRGTNRVFQDRNDRPIHYFNYGQGVKTEAENEDL